MKNIAHVDFSSLVIENKAHALILHKDQGLKQESLHICLHEKCTAVSGRNVSKLCASQTEFIFLPETAANLMTKK